MKNITIIIAVLLLIGGSIYFMQKDKSVVANTPAPAAEVAPAEVAAKSPAPAVAKETVGGSATVVESKYTVSSVATHNTKDSCWLIFEGKVYDVSPFIALGMHKAGVDVIIKNCGKDVTDSFSKAHDGKDKPFAMLETYLLGALQ